MAYFKRNLGIIILLAIVFTTSMLYWRKTREQARVLREGIYRQAQVTNAWFIKNDWKVNVRYRLGTSVYTIESVEANRRYSLGDSITIKVLPDKPEGEAIVIDN